MTATRPALLRALERRVLLADGAMGTELQRAGLEPGGCGEAWNLDAPGRVLAIQCAYAAAGSDCLLTNTFGASRIMLERHDQEGRVADINRAAAELARRALGARDGFVLGDIGPFGGLMEPYGEVSRSAVEDAFAEQAQALVAGGVDAVVIETQTALEELEIGVRAARAAGAPVVIGSLAYDTLAESDEVRTMMGVSPELAAERLAEFGADIVAFNCGTGVDMRMGADVARRYRSVSSAPIMGQPNAGLPVLKGLEVVYKELPAEMAAGVAGLVAAGVRIIGGCCGSTPDHIRAFRAVLDELDGGAQ